MKSKFALLYVVFCFGFFGGSRAQGRIAGISVPESSAVQYELFELAIDIEASFDNPFLQEDISLDMLLGSPGGRKLVLPCYFDRSLGLERSCWKARFLPQESGSYVYRFQLKIDGKIVYLTDSSDFTASASKNKGILHKNDNWTFRYDNGSLFRGLGENLAWESRDDDDSKFFKALHEDKKYNYDYMLPSLVKHGGDYFRTWISSWNLPIDWRSGFNNSRYQSSDEYFNPSAVNRMDHLISLSDSLHLHMMLTLGQGSHNAKHGRYETSTADFFVDSIAKAQYKNRLRFIVARWGYSPSIGAWEFFNEIDNVQFRNPDNPIPAINIVKWHQEMSAYLASIDPFDHLITTSISHRDLDGLNSISDIDFNQKHIYKNNRALPTTIFKYTEDFRKPYVIGEYGYEYDWQKNFDLFADEMDSDFKRGLWYGLFSPTPILPLSWWWEYFDNRGTDAYLSRVRTILDEMMLSGKGSFEHVKVEVDYKDIEIYAVKCGKKTFVYLYNSAAVDKIANLDLAGFSLPKNGRLYDCENGKWNNQRLNFSANRKTKGITVKSNSDLVLVF
jgi:hypothetical protein